MILAIDVGNTHVVIGLFEHDKLVENWRLVTEPYRTSDEYEVLLRNLFAIKKISFESVTGIIISCVVPPMLSTLQQLSVEKFNKEPFFVTPEIDMGMKLCYDNPKEIGADRIVNSIAAFEKYRRSLIVIDFGTATTFDCISERGEYTGGVISPGIRISAEALFQKASKLPRVNFVCPEHVVATNTVESMQAGIVYGYISLIEGIVARIQKELSDKPYVVATGGLAPLIAAHTDIINDVDEYLTLEGLRFIYNKLVEDVCS